ncbi:sensor histidine kinase [Cryobacterium zhongshanensis]|uniref:histidine kinase n=1 Tax=Cryobacterium zhongshanensis TaxID=2928153 RepID=A0AA41R1N8_9MICO|nr:HAMP domain-containing sensor histidine kinase [Cryobacterium zhongshanensis]MCI4659491.1 HAMP domain-containing histidine kinase [Cryobacterium zhongshanensis]
MQLTLSYAALLLLVGLALFVVAFLILRFIPEGNLIVVGGAFAPGRDDLIEVFVRYSLLALLALAAVGLGGGWVLAGRLLRPLIRITDAARRARDGSLTHRIGMPGRHNELAELADTFDDMLEQVQRSVEEQRRFAANASHELRTPHAIVRTMLEVARADPQGRDIEELLRRIDATNERSIVLIEAMLDLAEVDHRERPSTVIDIDRLVVHAVAEAGQVARDAQVAIETNLGAGAIAGDSTLLRQLIGNLLQNALAYNHPQGKVWISTTHGSGGVLLTVANTGEVLAQTIVDTLVEPFVRGHGRTRRPGGGQGGSGLGLALVSSIARAHSASVTLTARSEGGLTVQVLLPGPTTQQRASDLSPAYPFLPTEL